MSNFWGAHHATGFEEHQTTTQGLGRRLVYATAWHSGDVSDSNTLLLIFLWVSWFENVEHVTRCYNRFPQNEGT